MLLNFYFIFTYALNYKLGCFYLEILFTFQPSLIFASKDEAYQSVAANTASPKKKGFWPYPPISGKPAKCLQVRTH